MAGHSKWAKLKHFKGLVDAKRGKIFSRISRDITIAAKTGGGDPAMNPRLRTLLLKAREANMPADNIDRAIKKGTGELPGVIFEDALYEGYGPGGVALMVKVTTDNKNRAAAAVRNAFTRHGGNLAGAGAVAYHFQHAGQFLIAKDHAPEDTLLEVALAAGADDLITTEEGYEVRCPPPAFDKLANALEEAGIKPASSEIAYIPTTTKPLEGPEAAALEKLHETLDELDDVQQIFSNEATP
ncbi:MAG: YebC/PmpR family DNA-binding transcriptional regulator [Opitutaceae bacterium]|jgi:YebC/PmpR family DNA-binding regulatory protein|nr:YebC/PmpR family DNA-binding transcriptional regulator [Opitutaceae bacterium]